MNITTGISNWKETYWFTVKYPFFLKLSFSSQSPCTPGSRIYDIDFVTSYSNLSFFKCFRLQADPGTGEHGSFAFHTFSCPSLLGFRTHFIHQFPWEFDEFTTWDQVDVIIHVRGHSLRVQLLAPSGFFCFGGQSLLTSQMPRCKGRVCLCFDWFDF